MTDYTPTTEDVRGDYARFQVCTDAAYALGDFAAALAEFDRWLVARDAQKRAEWEAEHATEWEYRFHAVNELDRHVISGWTDRETAEALLDDPGDYAVEAWVERRRKAGPVGRVPIWDNEEEARSHECESCEACLHDGHRCCGCYDGACCQETARQEEVGREG